MFRRIGSSAEVSGGLVDPPRQATAAPASDDSGGQAPPSRQGRGLPAGLRAPSRGVLWLAILGGLGGLAVYGAALWAAGCGQAFVDAAVPRIVREWDSRELSRQATPALLLDRSLEQLEQTFEHYAADLGPLQAYRGSTLRAGPAVAWSHGVTITAAYAAMVTCKRGHVLLHVRVVWREDRWRIDAFEVQERPLLHYEL